MLEFVSVRVGAKLPVAARYLAKWAAAHRSARAAADVLSQSRDSKHADQAADRECSLLAVKSPKPSVGEMLATKPPVELSTAFYCEIFSALGAGAYVLTGCWVGYLVAVNGIITHGITAAKHPASPVAALVDTICNTAIIAFGIATSQWKTGSIVCGAVIAVGFLLSRLVNRRPVLSVLLHVLVAQLPGAIAVWKWCECNAFQCAGGK